MPPLHHQYGEKEYTANWEYWYNTDGGVIGPFVNSNSVLIKIEILKLGDIKNIEFASDDGQVFKIPNSGKKLTFFIKTHSETLDRPIAVASQDGTVSTTIMDDCSNPNNSPISIQIDQVTSVNLQTPPPVVCPPGAYCTEMIRASDWLIKGIFNYAPTQKGLVKVNFPEYYSDCAVKAKKAALINKPLIINGRGFELSDVSSERNVQFLQIDSCEILAPTICPAPDFN